MTAIAKNFFLARAAADGLLSEEEYKGLLELVFDAEDSFAQVDLNAYATVDAFIDGSVKTGSVPFTPQNEDAQHVLRYLASGFPGSLASFKSRLSRYFGIALTNFDTPLPALSLTRFDGDAKRLSLYHFAVTITGTDPTTGESYSTDYTFDFDTAKPYEEQGFVAKKDPILSAVVSDAMEFIGTAYNEGTLSQKPLYEEFIAKMAGFPNNGRDLTALLKAQALLVGPECDQLNNQSEPFPESQRLAGTPGAIPAYGDGTMSASDLKKIYGEACRIVGDGVLSFLADNGVTIGFYDFDELARATQTKTAAQGYAEYDFIGDGPAGITDYRSKKIIISTELDPDLAIMTVVHEMGHAVNLLIQQENLETEHYVVTNPNDGTTQEMFGYEFSGAQKSVYLGTAFMNDEKMGGWDSQYASSNDAEWFAEKFLYVMLERGDRLDLLKHNADHNPLLELSPILVDPAQYFLMTKIVQTLDEHDAKPENLKMLMERGIDDALWEACYQATGTYDVWSYEEESAAGLITIRSQLKAKKSSPYLDGIIGDWQRLSITALYTVKPDEDFFTDDNYRQTVMRNWESRNTPETRDLYVTNEFGAYPAQWLADRIPDFKAVFLAVTVERTDLTTEEKGRILCENGIVDETSLGFFCQNLTSIEPEQVKPVLGKPELLAAAQTALALKFAASSYLSQYYEESLSRADNDIRSLRPAEPIATLERLARINPPDPRPLMILAAAYALSGRDEDAQTAVLKIAPLIAGRPEIKPEIRDFYLLLAESYAAAGKLPETLALCDLARSFADDPAVLAAKTKALKKQARHPIAPPVRTLPEPQTPAPSSDELSPEELRNRLLGGS